jgi:hypothetical protein
MSIATETIYDVFLCHGPHDLGIARIVRDAFEEEDLEVFAVHEIRPDEAFLSELRWALAECHAMVLLLTHSTLGSPDVALEVGMATAWNKPVYVLFDGIAKSQIPHYLHEFHVLPVSKLHQVVKEIRESQQPLSTDQVQRLLKAYQDFAVPTDKLLVKPLLLRDLTQKYNRSTKGNVDAQKLIQELIRLRKQGKLPKVRG